MVFLLVCADFQSVLPDVLAGNEGGKYKER